MATLLLKKSYRHKDLKEIKFNDLWNLRGIFTTMRVIGKPTKILFFKNHINNLINSLKLYEPYKSENIKITMRCYKTNIAMAFEDIKNDIYGFQFHPESFLTKNGDFIIKKILSTKRS